MRAQSNVTWVFEPRLTAGVNSTTLSVANRYNHPEGGEERGKKPVFVVKDTCKAKKLVHHKHPINTYALYTGELA